MSKLYALANFTRETDRAIEAKIADAQAHQDSDNSIAKLQAQINELRAENRELMLQISQHKQTPVPEVPLTPAFITEILSRMNQMERTMEALGQRLETRSSKPHDDQPPSSTKDIDGSNAPQQKQTKGPRKRRKGGIHGATPPLPNPSAETRIASRPCLPRCQLPSALKPKRIQQYQP